MPTVQYTQTVSVGGVTIAGPASRTADGQISQVVSLPAAQAGTLSTRTNDTDGTLTLGDGHGIVTAALIDLFWAGGRRYGVIVGTVDGDSVPISGGAGDNLPAQATAITASVVTVVDVDFVGNLAVLLAASLSCPGRLDIQQAGGTLIAGLDLAAGEPWTWVGGGPATNPLAGQTVGKLVAGNAATTVSEMRFGVLYDSD